MGFTPMRKQLPPSEVEPPVQTQATRLQIKAAFSGPLPPPEIMKAYNDIIPDGAERILAMAESQASHRQELEKVVVKANSWHQVWGIVAAFAVTIIVIGAGTFLIYNDKGASGLTMVITNLVSLAGVFVYARQSQQRERHEKSEPFRSD